MKTVMCTRTSLLVERGYSTGEALHAMEDFVVEGPAVRSLTAYWAGDPKGQWVLDAGWPGVRVVEKPLLEGEQVVTVALNPGAR